MIVRHRLKDGKNWMVVSQETEALVVSGCGIDRSVEGSTFSFVSLEFDLRIKSQDRNIVLMLEDDDALSLANHILDSLKRKKTRGVK